MRKPVVVALVGTVVLAGLAGCSEKVLDNRNAEISNGKLYAKGANEPFTGQVTNVPDAALIGHNPGVTDVLKAVKNVWAKDPAFTDSLKNTPGMCDARYKDGLAEGTAVCREPQSDVKRYELTFHDGKLSGPFRLFDRTPKAQLVMETAFKEDKPDGKEELYGHETQKVIYRGFRKDGVGVGTEEGWDEHTGALIGHDHYVDGKIDGEIVRYTPDGKRILVRAWVKAGKKNGLDEQFYANGKPRFRGNWVNGEPDGHTQSWTETGELTDRYYEHGVQVMPPEYTTKTPAS
jgi:antitoxin component YwqK of YwqJK toxin-antitoxin module